MASTFGNRIKVSIFGQSHSKGIGVSLDNIPAGMVLDEEKLGAFLERRAPGRDENMTQRKEEDKPEFLSGFMEDEQGRLVTCGAPISAIIRNNDAKSEDYEELKDIPRPGHADFTAHIKYGGFEDYRSGGHLSGRLTAPLCVAGGIALQVLEQLGIRVSAEIDEIGGQKIESREQADALIEEVKDEGYDNIAIDTFAYKYSRKAPKNIVPEENVIVRYCTIEGCYSHALNDPDCPENAALAADLKEWCAICDRMYIWDYATNYSFTIGIFPDFDVLQKNIQYFYEMGMKGVFEEGNYYIDQCDAEFGELRAYLIARLLRDPYCDVDQEMQMFCDNYYGAGGRYVKAAIEAIHDRKKDSYFSIYHKMVNCFSISQEEADEIDKYWDLARESCENERTLNAVVRSELSWRYVKAMLRLSEFSGTAEERRAEKEKLYNDLVAHGVTRFSEWEMLSEKMIDHEEME